MIVVRCQPRLQSYLKAGLGLGPRPWWPLPGLGGTGCRQEAVALLHLGPLHAASFPGRGQFKSVAEAAFLPRLGSHMLSLLLTYSVFCNLLYSLKVSHRAHPILRGRKLGSIFWWLECQRVCEHRAKPSQLQGWSLALQVSTPFLPQ